MNDGPFSSAFPISKRIQGNNNIIDKSVTDMTGPPERSGIKLSKAVPKLPYLNARAGAPPPPHQTGEDPDRGEEPDRARARGEAYRGENRGMTERKLKSMERKALNGLRN